MLVKMRTSKTIFVAALNGASAGGGLGLALACDARIASPNGKMAASYSGIGLSPDGGTTWLLPRLVGEQTARRFSLKIKFGVQRKHANLEQSTKWFLKTN